jgi:hypothetical protein
LWTEIVLTDTWYTLECHCSPRFASYFSVRGKTYLLCQKKTAKHPDAAMQATVSNNRIEKKKKKKQINF